MVKIHMVQEMYGHNNGPGVSKGGHTRYYEVDFVDEDVVMLTRAVVCLFIPPQVYTMLEGLCYLLHSETVT